MIHLLLPLLQPISYLLDLEISKRESTKGEATITKEPITETKEVEVPVTH
jgi:stress response protein YsnF